MSELEQELDGATFYDPPPSIVTHSRARTGVVDGDYEVMLEGGKRLWLSRRYRAEPSPGWGY
jgi:hypothetical protein